MVLKEACSTKALNASQSEMVCLRPRSQACWSSEPVSDLSLIHERGKCGTCSARAQDEGYA